MADRDPASLPAEVRAKLAELELELSEGESVASPALSLPEAGGKGSPLGLRGQEEPVRSLRGTWKFASRWNRRARLRGDAGLGPTFLP